MKILYMFLAVFIGFSAPACFMAAQIEDLPTDWNNAAFGVGLLCLAVSFALACWWPEVSAVGEKKEERE